MAATMSKQMEEGRWKIGSGTPLTPSLSPSDGERVASGRVRGATENLVGIARFSIAGQRREGASSVLRLKTLDSGLKGQDYGTVSVLAFLRPGVAFRLKSCGQEVLNQQPAFYTKSPPSSIFETRK